MNEIKKYDIIQIHPDNQWGGCLAIVDEVKSWGVQCFVVIPLQGDAYYRVKNEEFVKVGTCAFTPIER